MIKELPDIIKIRFTLEQKDCNGNTLKKENKSVMLILSGDNQWNCLSFTACGEKYNMQISLNNNKYTLKLGKIDTSGFIHEAFRFFQGGVSGKYRPSEDFECINGSASIISEAEVL